MFGRYVYPICTFKREVKDEVRDKLKRQIEETKRRVLQFHDRFTTEFIRKLTILFMNLFNILCNYSLSLFSVTILCHYSLSLFSVNILCQYSLYYFHPPIPNSSNIQLVIYPTHHIPSFGTIPFDYLHLTILTNIQCGVYFDLIVWQILLRSQC